MDVYQTMQMCLHTFMIGMFWHRHWFFFNLGFVDVICDQIFRNV